MDGLMLIDNGEVIAFSMGARMNELYYDVCFEKAYSAINGAYAMINREFSRMIAQKYPELQFLNREDDMGEPGLRKAKESYQPTLPAGEKYNATLTGGRVNAHQKDRQGGYPGVKSASGRRHLARTEQQDIDLFFETVYPNATGLLRGRRRRAGVHALCSAADDRQRRKAAQMPPIFTPSQQKRAPAGRGAIAAP